MHQIKNHIPAEREREREMRRACCENMGVKKGPWTPEEDQILISHVNRYGHENWRAIPRQAGLFRCGKSCRLRWSNYLKPGIKRGNFTKEEEGTIISLYAVLGSKWSRIAASLPGRTDNEIKNLWHSHLKKRFYPNQNMKLSKPRKRRGNGNGLNESMQKSKADMHDHALPASSTFTTDLSFNPESQFNGK